jgi:hypothetical protein
VQGKGEEDEDGGGKERRWILPKIELKIENLTYKKTQFKVRAYVVRHIHTNGSSSNLQFSIHACSNRL